jgi:predicted MFS family arabinose efflux permease
MSLPHKYHERWLLLLMATIQFTTVLDFLIIMPLGPQYMRVLHITPAQFGVIVSAYALSAGISGVAACFFLDRFDRKTGLLLLYGGFCAGTFLCALAPTYPLLVAARACAGAFGGIAGALILAIIGDVIPDERRGAAMGLVMSSFAIASICGVPIGLYLASVFNWHAPFLVLAGLSVLILVAAVFVMPSLRGHLHHAYEQHPVARVWAVLMERDHQLAFLFMALLVFAGASIFPFIATYMVANVGLTEKQLPLIYLTSGLFTLFSTNWIGRWADRAGKLRVFTFVTLSTAVPILLLTNLARVPLPAALATSTLFMICMSGRFVPAMALLTATVEDRYRGGFMSINSSVQQFAAGLAAAVSGRIMGQTAAGQITHFPAIGVMAVACSYTCIYLARYLRPAKKGAISPALCIEQG